MGQGRVVADSGDRRAGGRDGGSVAGRMARPRRTTGVPHETHEPALLHPHGYAAREGVHPAAIATARPPCGHPERVHAHGLRHTHAAELRSEGVDIGIISKQLGHRSITTTARYLDHISPWAVVEVVRMRGVGVLARNATTLDIAMNHQTSDCTGKCVSTRLAGCPPEAPRPTSREVRRRDHPLAGGFCRAGQGRCKCVVPPRLGIVSGPHKFESLAWPMTRKRAKAGRTGPVATRGRGAQACETHRCGVQCSAPAAWKKVLASRLREVFGDLTYREIARATGHNHETVRRFLASGSPSVAFLVAVSRRYGVSVDWLVGFRGKR